MKLFGSIKELVSAVFRKNSQEITLRPSQTTTYTAARDIQLPPGDTAHELVSATSTQTLTNKSIDADTNTVTNIENADIKAAAAIARTKLASGSVSHVVVNDGSGVMTSEAQLDRTRGGTGVSSTATFPTSGTVVTEAGTQTLTNKTISGASNTVTNVSLTTGVTGTLPLGNGGSGQITANAALNAFLPSQTANTGKALTTDGSNTAWTNVATDPTTTRGDLIRRGAAALERLAAVANNTVVRGNGTDVVSGQIDAPAFFTTGAAASGTDIGIVTTGAQTFAGAKTIDATGVTTPLTLGSDAAAGTRSLSVRTGASQRPELNMFQNNGSKLIIGVASGTNDLVTGSSGGRPVFRSVEDMFFTVDGAGTVIAMRLQSSGNTVQFPQGIFVDDQANQTALNFCREGSFTTICTGPFASQNITTTYSRVGNQIVLHFVSNRPNGNLTGAPITFDFTNMPATIRPVSGLSVPVATVTNAGSDQASPGVLTVGTSGNGTMTLSGAVTNFTATTTTVGFYGFSVSYTAA